jgi:hypothetical protein
VDDHEHNEAAIEAWAQWADYADEVRVAVRFREWLGADGDEDEAWTIHASGSAWQRDWLTRELTGIAAAGDDDCGGRGNFELEVKTRKIEWGASAAAYELILTLPQALLDAGIGTVVGAVAGQMATKLKPMFGDLDSEPLTEEDAEHGARMAVVLSRSVDADSLQLRSLEVVSADMAVVVLHHAASSVTYDVEVRSLRNTVRLSRIRKRTMDA